MFSRGTPFALDVTEYRVMRMSTSRGDTMNTAKLENGASEHFHHAVERLGELKGQVADAVGELKGQVADAVGPRISSFAAVIKKHPFAAIAVGLVLGYVGTRLARRAA
jgi:hypothetical protein